MSGANMRKHLGALHLGENECSFTIYQATGELRGQNRMSYKDMTLEGIKETVFELLKSISEFGQELGGAGMGITSTVNVKIPVEGGIMLLQDYITSLLSGRKDIAKSIAAKAKKIHKEPLVSREIEDCSGAGFINSRLAQSLGLPFSIAIIPMGEDTDDPIRTIIKVGLMCRRYNSILEATEKFPDYHFKG
ncbi:MAG: hypothetical protein E7388_07665 [Ruminococcaceae bacterium]|nr:hypothetical protein [Oscillospiraceae bacterium]